MNNFEKLLEMSVEEAFNFFGVESQSDMKRLLVGKILSKTVKCEYCPAQKECEKARFYGCDTIMSGWLDSEVSDGKSNDM